MEDSNIYIKKFVKISPRQVYLSCNYSLHFIDHNTHDTHGHAHTTHDTMVHAGRQCYAGPAYQRSEEVEDAVVNNMALSVGNLYGLGYRVGQSIKVRFESVPELIAVINAPPTHFDVIDGKEVVVNPRTFNGFGSSTRLSNAEGVTSSFDISRDLVHVSSVAAGVRLASLSNSLLSLCSLLSRQLT